MHRNPLVTVKSQFYDRTTFGFSIQNASKIRPNPLVKPTSHCTSGFLLGLILQFKITPDHLLLDSAPNLGPLIFRWEINRFEDCGYKSVGILEILKLLFQQFLNFSSSQRDTSGPILGDLSNNR
jgi:hypothetical protein